MNRNSSNIIFLIAFQLVLLTIAGCKREPANEEPITPGVNVSDFQDNVVRLDTLVFTNPVRTNGQVRFDLIGTPPQIKTGDLIYYPAGNGLYGKVTSSVTAGSRMIFQLEKAGIGELFKNILVQDNNGSNVLKTKTRLDPERWKSDTLDLSGLYLYNDTWQNKLLQVKFDSGKLSAVSALTHFMLAGQGVNPWFDRFGLSMRYALDLTGSINIKTTTAANATDSIRIENAVYGPVIINGFPITFQVDTWLGFHVVTLSDTVLTMKLSGITSGNVSLNYNYWDSWKFVRTSAGKSANILTYGGPRTASYTGEFYVNQIVTPYFCGEPSLLIGNRFTADFSSVVNVPSWQTEQKISEKGIMSRTGSVFGSEVPENLLSAESMLYLESQTGVLENQKPTASFVINPQAGFTDTNFEFDASASKDLETPSAALQVRWDFNADNHFDTEFSTTKVTYYKFLTPGTYKPVLEVMDAGGLTSRTTITLEVGLSSSAPVANFTVTPESGRISDYFIFNALGSYDAQDATTLLKVRWDFNGDDVWETGWSTNKIAVYVFREPGRYIAKLEVLDTQGLSGSTTRIIDVSNVNLKPTAIFTVDPLLGTTETKFSFDASGCTDPEDSAATLRVRWDWEKDGIYDTDYSTVKKIQHTFTTAGVYTVVMEVIDTEGYGSTFEQEIKVSNPNTPPAADFSVSPSPGLIDDVITFDASLCTDKEDGLDQLQVRWDWDNDNVYETEFSTTKIATRTYSEAGTYIVKMQVKDSGGLTDTRVRLVTINIRK